jgi:hypothetical protein
MSHDPVHELLGDAADQAESDQRDALGVGLVEQREDVVDGGLELKAALQLASFLRSVIALLLR